nr:hypothetical protein [Vibrio parahaemolyticus]
MKDCHEIKESEVITFDVKTVRGSFNQPEDRSASYGERLCREQGLCLGKSKVDDKTNEIT